MHKDATEIQPSDIKLNKLAIDKNIPYGRMSQL